ncbi:MAG: hypothetical protein WKF84_17485 [Pyrinomonadaceae bacterium]
MPQFLKAEESIGEVDQSPSFHIARSLDGLKESLKAQARYREFLKSSLCTGEPPDARCRIAQERLSDLGKNLPYPIVNKPSGNVR